MNITFIQLSTRHDYFSLADVHLIFFFFFFFLVSVWVLFFVRLFSTRKSHFTQPNSYNSVTNADPLFFVCCVIHFLFSKHISSSFRFWRFHVFRDQAIHFPFFTITPILYFHQIIDTVDREYPTHFLTLPYRLPFCFHSDWISLF